MSHTKVKLWEVEMVDKLGLSVWETLTVRAENIESAIKRAKENSVVPRPKVCKAELIGVED